MVAPAFVRPTAASLPLAFLRGTAVPTAQDLFVVDACVVRLLFEGLAFVRPTAATPPLAVLQGGWWRPLLVASSSLTSAMLVGVVGQRHPPLATSSSSKPAPSASSSRASAKRPPEMVAATFVRPTAASLPLAFLRGTVAPAARSLIIVNVGNAHGSGGRAAPAAQNLVVIDTCVVRLLFKGLRLMSELDGRGRLRAADGRLFAPRLLAGDGGARSSRPRRR